MQAEQANGEVRDHDKDEEGKGKGKGNGKEDHPLPLRALNHVSRLCRNVQEAVEFYTKVLGFVLIERPDVLDFEGAWLFNYGIGIHLVQSKDEKKLPETENLDPMDNHISFECDDMEAMVEKLKQHKVKYMERTMEDENGTKIDQLFFNDPDGFMIEICNCENLKLVTQASIGKLKLPFDRHNPPVESNDQEPKSNGKLPYV